MKKTIMTRLSMGLLLAAAASSALAQGDITFNTYNVDSSKGRIFLSGGFLPGSDGWIPVPSTFAGQLWWSDTSGGTFVAAGTAQVFDSIVPGYIFDGRVVIPGHDAGTTIWYQLRYWNYAAGGDWNSATRNGNPYSNPLLIDYGITQSVRVTLGGIDSDGNVFFPRQANGFRSNSIPEPTTISLAGLGLASLLIYRRRKQDLQLFSRGTARKVLSMKKTIITGLSLGSLMVAGASSAFAQGTITLFTHNGANLSLGQVFLPAELGGGGVTSNYLGQLYWSDTSNGTFAPLNTTQAFDSTALGYIVQGISVTVPGHDPGLTVWFQLHVWNASAGSSYEAALTSPSLIAYGISEPKSRTLGGTDTDGNPYAPQTFNHFTNFVLTARPALSSSMTGSELILSWSGPCVLQSSTNLTGDFSDVSGAGSPYTNSTTSSAQQFFRLRD